MIAGIVGLGLIGGSFAKAYSAAGHTVYGWNRTHSVIDFALTSGDIHGELTEENIAECDVVIVTLYPEASIEFIRRMAPFFGKKPVVIDCCGTKRVVCDVCFPIAEEHGFCYVGGHPMAGNKYSGFEYAKGDLYRDQPMVIVPPDFDDVELLDKVKKLLSPAGFGLYSVTTAEKHDAMIAFTSQLAHLVSNAYIKSPTAMSHRGFSAGSYKDLTRVAWLNPGMWAELFMENKDYLLYELDTIIENLLQYKQVMENDDLAALIQLLDDGRRIKEEVDG